MFRGFAVSENRKHARLIGGVAAALLAMLTLGARVAGASPYIVWTVNDPADPPVAGDAKCQLREAIALANGGAPNSDCPPVFTPYTSNVISINLAGGGFQSIMLTSELPSIVRPVFIDASAESGGPPPMVGLIGGGANAFGCLTFDTGSDGSRLVGLRITKCQPGVKLQANNITLQKNWFGTADGVTSRPNGGDILVINSSGNHIGQLDVTYPDLPSNVISSHIDAIIIQDGTSNTIQSNYVGLTADGTAALGVGSGTGIRVCGDSVTIGGSLPNQGNVISGQGTGIDIGCNSQYTNVYRNKIGTDATGMVSLGNQEGIVVDGFSSRTMIGGLIPTYSNLIDSPIVGIAVRSLPGATPNLKIMGNLIGVDASGDPMTTQTDVELNTYATASTVTVSSNVLAGATYTTLAVGNVSGVPDALAGSTNNCIVWSASGAVNNGTVPVNLKLNWWADPTGPHNLTANPFGLGESVSDLINVRPWLITPPYSCDGYAPPRNAPRDNFYPWPLGRPSAVHWSRVPTANGYHVTLADNPAFLNPVIDLDTQGTSAKVGPLGYGEWFWQTTTLTADHFAWKSPLHNFFVTIQRSPKPLSTVKAGSVRFSWAKYVPTPFDYSFQLYSDAKCGTPSGGPASVTGLSTSVSLASGMYSWNLTPKGGPTMPCWVFTVK